MKEPRRVAAAALARITDDDGFTQHVLDATLNASGLEGRDRGWVTATVKGVLSDLRAIDLALNRALDRGVDALFGAPLAHLRIATWEIGRRQLEPAPVVNAAVNAAAADGPRRFRGLVNAVLRRVAADREILFNPPKKATDAARFGIEHGLPDWIAERLLTCDVDRSEVMAAWNGSTATAFRVRDGALEPVLEELRAEGLDVRRHPVLAACGVCDRGHVAGSRSHANGRISIADAGAQLAVAALPTDASRVLDLCAGIGGKTLALADRFAKAELAAADRSGKKLNVLRRSLGSREVDAKIWDVGVGERPFDAAPFDVVLVDAPCSALGTLGRHPEVRWNREPEVVEAMATIQRQILDEAAPLVAVGGTLLFVVCTWTSEETVAQVERFLGQHTNFELTAPTSENATPDLDWGAVIDGSGTATLWPHTSESDGFFFARFTRTS